jgi:HlyD family secretion protein
MKRWKGIVVAAALIAMIGGAGYLGSKSVKGESPSISTEPATVGVAYGDVETTVTAPGHLVNVYEQTLGFRVGGIVAEVYVRPGQKVTAGALLARLEAEPLLNSVTDAQASLEVARARLKQLQAGPSTAELAAAELALISAEAQLRRLKAGPSTVQMVAASAEVAAAQNELESLRSLPNPQAVAQAQAQFDKAVAALQQAQAAYDLVKGRPDVAMLPQSLALQQATIDWELAKAYYEAAQLPATAAEVEAARIRVAAAEANLAQLQSTPSADELAVAELQVEVAEARLEELTSSPARAELCQAEAAARIAELVLARALTALEAATLTAPFDGIILEVRTQAGATVSAGAGLFLLADPSVLEAEVTVIEEDLPLVQVGQEVVVFFDAAPEAEVRGMVARIVPQRLPGDRPVYPVYVAVANQSESLVAGMTADASIIVDSRQNVLRLPRALVRTRPDGTGTVQVWTGTGTVERQVQTGLRGDAFVEIVDGLEEGDRVVTQ